MNRPSIHNLQSEDLADLLKKAGSTAASPALIRKMIQAGAPANADGTIDLVKFTAYMMGKRNGKLQ